MGIIYGRKVKGSTSRYILIAAPAALALIILLLWFGSTRNPDPAADEERRPHSDCPKGTPENCQGAVPPTGPATQLSLRNHGDSEGVRNALNGGIKRAPASPGADTPDKEPPTLKAGDGPECRSHGGWSCLFYSTGTLAIQTTEAARPADSHSSRVEPIAASEHRTETCPLPGTRCFHGIEGTGVSRNTGEPALRGQLRNW